MRVYIYQVSWYVQKIRYKSTITKEFGMLSDKQTHIALVRIFIDST